MANQENQALPPGAAALVAEVLSFHCNSTLSHDAPAYTRAPQEGQAEDTKESTTYVASALVLPNL